MEDRVDQTRKARCDGVNPRYFYLSTPTLPRSTSLGDIQSGCGVVRVRPRTDYDYNFLALNPLPPSQMVGRFLPLKCQKEPAVEARDCH